jgi:tetratricopeptide (TPR) repeat protein
MNFSINSLTSGLSGIRKPFQFLLIAFLVITVYYPAFFAGWCHVDDITIINRVRDIGVKDLDLIFTPGFSKAVYYRPIIKFSFWLHKYIGNFDAFWMHAGNVVLHIFNAFLVYGLALQLTRITGRQKSSAPLLAAILFALHPVNSESVNWIAGRSDVLAGFFILLCANALLKARDTGSHRWMLMAGIAILPGFLTKEVALVFLPGAVALLIASNIVQGKHGAVPNESDRDVNRQLRSFLLAGLICLAVFFLLRSFGIHQTERRLADVINRIIGDLPSALVVFLQALGFYFKKLLIPVPLNFSILEVDPLYFFLGLPAVALLFIILRQQPMHGAFLVTGIFLISPAFMIAMGKFAWTSYAERYVYVASAFIIPAVTDLGTQAASRTSRKGVYITVRAAVIACVLVFAAVSYHRSVVWMSDETLFRDTIEKNPQIISLRIDYAILLTDEGRLDAASDQLAVVSEKRQKKMERIMAQLYDNESIDLSVNVLFAEAYILERKGKIHESLKKYEELIEPQTKWSGPALERASVLALTLISRSNSSYVRIEAKNKLKTFGQMMYDRQMDPELLYIIGKTFWVRKDFAAAKYYFRMARDRSSETNVYRQFSEKMLSNLNGET